MSSMRADATFDLELTIRWPDHSLTSERSLARRTRFKQHTANTANHPKIIGKAMFPYP